METIVTHTVRNKPLLADKVIYNVQQIHASINKEAMLLFRFLILSCTSPQCSACASTLSTTEEPQVARIMHIRLLVCLTVLYTMQSTVVGEPWSGLYTPLTTCFNVW